MYPFVPPHARYPMTTFNEQELFNSGPSRLTPGPIALRSSEQNGPAGEGTALLSQGQHARTILQRGQLRADSKVALYELMDRIEDMIDGLAYTLVDADGKPWLGCVMTRFEPTAVTRRGARVSVDYEIHYTQVQL